MPRPAQHSAYANQRRKFPPASVAGRQASVRALDQKVVKLSEARQPDFTGTAGPGDRQDKRVVLGDRAGGYAGRLLDEFKDVVDRVQLRRCAAIPDVERVVVAGFPERVRSERIQDDPVALGEIDVVERFAAGADRKAVGAELLGDAVAVIAGGGSGSSGSLGGMVPPTSRLYSVPIPLIRISLGPLAQFTFRTSASFAVVLLTVTPGDSRTSSMISSSVLILVAAPPFHTSR